MNRRGFLKGLLRSDKTVFSFKDLILMWGVDPGTARSRVSYYIKSGELYPIRRGLYSKDKNYDRLELATRILTPSYVSFETILAGEGIIFQYYGQIFVAAYQTREISCDSQAYVFRKIRDTILVNNGGIEDKGNYLAASKERAFLDTLYLNKGYYFDNLRPLDWNKVQELSAIYESKRIRRDVERYSRENRE